MSQFQNDGKMTKKRNHTCQHSNTDFNVEQIQFLPFWLVFSVKQCWGQKVTSDCDITDKRTQETEKIHIEWIILNSEFDQCEETNDNPKNDWNEKNDNVLDVK